MTTDKFQQFRQQLCAPELSFLMEAHNGLSAKIVEDAGFKGIWASGLSMSASLGLRDSNEASWTQVMDVLEFMADATTIPIMLDGDTGYGNFNNFRLLVKKLCQNSIAAVCIEDKLFPKTNSFIGDNQPLADIEEFCGKIKAGKDAQTAGAFSIVARVEALIAGWGLDEALRRAEAYRVAGADGILIHSKHKNGQEILEFAREWANRAPLVIVPTTYYAVPTERFQEAGISMIIWANHNLRAALSAMRDVSRQIFNDQSLTGVEEHIAPVKDIFEIAGNDELAAAESRYLMRSGSQRRAIVLAASRGAELGALTEDQPKCMVDVRGQPLLRRLVTAFNDSGIRDITVVRGYGKETVDLPTIKTIDNDAYADTGEVASLDHARALLEGECLISFGDILFRRYIVEQLLDVEGDVVLVVDANWKDRTDILPAGRRDLALCSGAYTGDYLDGEDIYLEKLDDGTALESAHGRWIGLAKVSARGAQLIRDEIDRMKADGSFEKAEFSHLFNRLIAHGEAVKVTYITGNWLDVNTMHDLATARNFL